jgi:hypothetical protein
MAKQGDCEWHRLTSMPDDSDDNGAGRAAFPVDLARFFGRLGAGRYSARVVQDARQP